MEENKRNQEFLNKIKEKVDFLYSLTLNVKFGESFKRFNDRLLDEVRAIMVKRGIIIKDITYPGQATGRKCTFTWNPTAPAPTKTLYITIRNDIVKAHRDKAKKYAEGKVNKPEYLNKVEVAPTESHDEPVVKDSEWFKAVPEVQDPVYSEQLRIFYYTDQELWNELKRRGYEIVDGKVAKVIKTYLD